MVKVVLSPVSPVAEAPMVIEPARTPVTDLEATPLTAVAGVGRAEAADRAGTGRLGEADRGRVVVVDQVAGRVADLDRQGPAGAGDEVARRAREAQVIGRPVDDGEGRAVTGQPRRRGADGDRAGEDAGDGLGGDAVDGGGRGWPSRGR